MNVLTSPPRPAKILGHLLDVHATATDPGAAQRAEHAVREEMCRMQELFDPNDPASMLSRWTRHPGSVETSPDFDDVLRAALDWQRRSGGAFNVRSARLGALWANAAASGCRPSDGELKETVREIAHAPYVFAGGDLLQTSDCRGFDVSAVAIAIAADRAVDAARRDHLLIDLTVEFDGHLIRRGAGHLAVAVHDTTREHVDHHPIAMIHLGDETIATRATHHRTRAGSVGFSTDIDPRSGRFILATPACTTISADASTAIVVSQILTVLDPEEGQTFVDEYNTALAASNVQDSAVRSLVLEPSGAAWRAGTWGSHKAVLNTRSSPNSTAPPSTPAAASRWSAQRPAQRPHRTPPRA